MGDRANILVLDRYRGADGHPGVFLYTHWLGSEIRTIAAQGLLLGHSRWTDHDYLTRILADHLSAQMSDRTTGMGIGIGIGDNEHPIVVIDPFTKQVWEADEQEAMVMPPGHPDRVSVPFNAVSFEDWIKAHHGR